MNFDVWTAVLIVLIVGVLFAIATRIQDAELANHQLRGLKERMKCDD